MKTETKHLTEATEQAFLYVTSGGMSILATPSEFKKNWLGYIIDRGEVFTAKPVSEDDSLIEVREENFLDPQGIRTALWAVYFRGRVLSLEFTRGRSGLTERVELREVA